MSRTRPPYPPEFRRQLIELVRSGRSPEALAAEFEPSAQTIRNWVVQAARDAGERHDGPTTAEQDDLRRLRREHRQLREEREILAKGDEVWNSIQWMLFPRNAWFARETTETPNGSSSSSR